MIRAARIVRGHARTIGALAAGAVAYGALLHVLPEPTRTIAAWDVFGLVFIGLITALMLEARPADMPAQAEAQEEGEWSIFSVTLLGVIVSFTALVSEFAGTKEMPPGERRFHIALVIATLAITWLVAQTVFGLRYAHEYYTVTCEPGVDKGLEFPGDDDPDYWDFMYFSIVLGMTFQVSDVQITSRKLRRLATLHGMFGFLFNTVLLALSVNLAANLL